MEKNEIAKVVGRYLRTSGYNVSYIEYANKIQEYLNWYRGKTAWHDYYVNTGTCRTKAERASLNMSKTVCEDMASLLLNEKVAIKLSDEKSQKLIDNILEDNNFRECSNQLMELACALGTGAFVESVDENNKTKIDYIHGDMIFPLSWENGKITECAFGKVGRDDDEVFYTLIIHELDDNGFYVIRTVDIDKKGKAVIPSNLASVGNSTDEVINTGSKVKLFQIIKPNIVNNYDKTCPLGMSIFGNAIDILKNIDVKYDSWRNEFETGKRKIFIKSDLYSVKYKIDSSTITPVVDPTDTIFYTIEWTKDDIPIHEFSPEIRNEPHSSGLDSELKLLSRKTGLGDGFYSFDNGAVARTATEIVSVNSSLYRNMRKHKIVLRSSLVRMCRALLELENIYKGGTYDVFQDITIDFDDSIIEDSSKIREEALKEFNNGLIDRVEYFVKANGMSREQALDYVAEMDATDTMKKTMDFANSSTFGGF